MPDPMPPFALMREMREKAWLLDWAPVGWSLVLHDRFSAVTKEELFRTNGV
jgi:hypothetical protein